VSGRAYSTTIEAIFLVVGSMISTWPCNGAYRCGIIGSFLPFPFSIELPPKSTTAKDSWPSVA
jgi:hypothetical protein